VAAVRCPNGHPLRPGRVLVGSIAYSCRRHLTWRCECAAVTYGPALADAACSMGRLGCGADSSRGEIWCVQLERSNGGGDPVR
jgi:hypothetical protein